MNVGSAIASILHRPQPLHRLPVVRAGVLGMELIKIGISVGAGLEPATRSHVRQALQPGASDIEIEQAVLLAYNTIGWPRMIAAWTWARQ